MEQLERKFQNVYFGSWCFQLQHFSLKISIIPNVFQRIDHVFADLLFQAEDYEM